MTFAALLLAGGESRRMGRDKATIEFESEPLWQRQLRILRTLQPEQIFVSARTAPSWLPTDVELLIDDPPSRGPLSGLAKALAASRSTHVIALAVDMPFMTTAQMRILCRLAGENCGIVPLIGERAEPVAAIYPRESALDFVAALAGHDFSIQRLVRELAAAGKVRLFPVSPKDEYFYRSVNAPEDLPRSER